MKTRARKCGVYVALAAVLLLSAALITSCVEPVSFGGLTVPQGKKETPFVPPEGMGYIRLSISVANSGNRTITPDTSAINDLNDFDDFRIQVIKPDDSIVYDEDEIEVGDINEPIVLPSGIIYTVRVFGYLDGVAVAVGEDDVLVDEAPTGGTATIILKEIVDGTGTGDFVWDLTPAAAPHAATSVSMEIKAITSVGGGTDVNVGDITSNLSNTSTPQPLNSGYYTVEITQTAPGHQQIITVSALHIYQGFTSTFVYNLPALKPNTYTVAFALNDGTSNNHTTSTVAHDGTVSEPGTNPTRTGYNFVEWCTDAAGATAYVFTTKVYNDLTLYAKWIKIHTVTFNYNDGETPDEFTTSSVVDGNTVTKPTPDPIRRGTGAGLFVFNEWCTDTDGDDPYDFDDLVTGDLPLYASWTAVSMGDLEVTLSAVTFTTATDPQLSASVSSVVNTGVTLVVTLGNPEVFDTWTWKLDGVDVQTDGNTYTFSTASIQYKYVGTYIITVYGSKDDITTSTEQRITVTVGP